MRIGMMLDMYKPYMSGVTNYVALNKRALEALGNTVFVFTFGGAGYRDEEPNVVRSPGLPLTVKNVGLHLTLRHPRQTQRILRSMDIVHVQHPFISGQLAFRYARAHGVPVVFTNHTRYDLYAQHYLPPFIPKAISQTFLQTYLRAFCRRCNLVIAPSAGLAAVLRHLGVTSEIKVIPNGVDLAPFQSTHSTLTRAQLGLPERGVVVMYLGRLGPEKNLPFLLQAFAGVAAACSEAILALVGGGPEAGNLQSRARRLGLDSRVLFLGQVPYAEVPAYFHLADIYATASQTEVHPLSLIEALAAGLPVVGVASPGVSDTIVDGHNGFLSPADLAAFTARLAQLVQEPEVRCRMATNAVESANQYDIHHTAGLLLREYERLVGLRAQRPNAWAGVDSLPRQWRP